MSLPFVTIPVSHFKNRFISKRIDRCPEKVLHELEIIHQTPSPWGGRGYIIVNSEDVDEVWKYETPFKWIMHLIDHRDSKKKFLAKFL